jgi:hypothetical protein
VFTARYGLIAYIKQITFSVYNVNLYLMPNLILRGILLPLPLYAMSLFFLNFHGQEIHSSFLCSIYIFLHKLTLITPIWFFLISLSDMTRRWVDVCCSVTSVMWRRSISSGTNHAVQNKTYLFNWANNTLLSVVPALIYSFGESLGGSIWNNWSIPVHLQHTKFLPR